ncbi:hypothetical protein D3C79_855500 [compost metagenome]
MSGIEQQIDTFIANELRQPFGTTVATDANLALQIRWYPTYAGQAVDVLRSQRAGNGHGFGHAAEQQDALH